MPFILIVIGVILVVLNYKALKKDESSFSDVLKYKQKDMTEVEVEIGAIRRDIAESLTELQKEVLEIKQHINFNNNVEDIKENLETDEELISNNLTSIDEEVDVINVEYIPDAYEAILQAEKDGLITVLRYEDLSEKRKKRIIEIIKEEYKKSINHSDYRHFLIGNFPDILKNE